MGSLIVLAASLIIVVVVWGVRVEYAPAAYYALAGMQLIVICVSAWKLGARFIRAGQGERQQVAAAGTLLVMPFALFALLAGVGPPGATAPEEQRRYLILLIDVILVAGGWIVLRNALSQAGERFYSTLGFAAITIAAPLYAVFTIILLGAHRTAQPANPGEWSPGFTSLIELGDIFLFFGGLLTYLATAAFTASLERLQWLGRAASRVLVTASLLSGICLVLRGLEFPDPNVAFMHWYTALGWLAGIPAIPWFIPCGLGVVLLRRAGRG